MSNNSIANVPIVLQLLPTKYKNANEHNFQKMLSSTLTDIPLLCMSATTLWHALMLIACFKSTK